MPHPQTGQKGSAGLLQCPRILLTCFRVRISDENHVQLMHCRDVEKSGNKDGVEEGSDKVGLLSVPPVATTASASSVVRSASAPSNLT